MRGGKYDSLRIISMPMYTGKMPGNLAEAFMFGCACVSSNYTLVMRTDGGSMDEM